MSINKYSNVWTISHSYSWLATGRDHIMSRSHSHLQNITHHVQQHYAEKATQIVRVPARVWWPQLSVNIKIKVLCAVICTLLAQAAHNYLLTSRSNRHLKTGSHRFVCLVSIKGHTSCICQLGTYLGPNKFAKRQRASISSSTNPRSAAHFVSSTASLRNSLGLSPASPFPPRCWDRTLSSVWATRTLRVCKSTRANFIIAL